jgi:L-xylulose reductase
MFAQFDFKGRRVLVTGGAAGLGLAIVKKFLEAGATVVVLDKDSSSIHELLEQHPTVEAIAVDLANWKQTTEAVSKVLPIHHLVNNAGVLRPAVPFLEIQSEDVDKIMDVNFKAIINVSQVVAGGMIKNNIEGTIVNISSVMSIMAYERTTLYCASKAAISNLTKSMALELGQHNIRVNSVSPTAMATSMNISGNGAPTSVSDTPNKVEADGAAFKHWVTNFINALVSRQVVKRLLTTEETAELILYLSSTASAMIVGEDVLIDGGIFAH